MRLPILFVPCLSLLAFGCSQAADGGAGSDETDQKFSSREAVLVDFEFDGELTTDSSFNAQQTIQDQFLYTIGHLNADRSVGRLDRLVLTNVHTAPAPSGSGYRVTYHAKMPVAWGNRTTVPSSYVFTLPRDVSYQGLESFTTKYKASCVDGSAHDVDSGSMWYYYRPKASGCSIAPADVVSFAATVARSTENTSGKYPEYQKVWEDDELDVVAIFGKYEDGATSPSDAGVSAFNQFVGSMRSTLGSLGLTTEPASLPSSPGIAVPDVTFHAHLADGKKINVTALLIDSVTNPGAAFGPRYEALSTKADVIAYNGHAGLGQNVRALARMGRWTSGKYLVLFMNGCDTFAYVDGSLAQTRAPLNPDDPTGTKYMDIVTNAMPAYFASDSGASTALIRGLMAVTQPKTFDDMFGSVDRSQVVLVTGEEDNAFTPGMPIGGGGGGGGGGSWTGMNEQGTVAKDEEARFTTSTLPAGSYTFTLAGSGDADLYVKRGADPTTSSYDCRPYLQGSNETCTVALTAPAAVHVMVRGWDPSSTFTLTGK